MVRAIREHGGVVDIRDKVPKFLMVGFTTTPTHQKLSLHL